MQFVVPRSRADLSRNHFGSLSKCAKLTAKCAFEIQSLDMQHMKCCIKIVTLFADILFYLAPKIGKSKTSRLFKNVAQGDTSNLHGY